MRLEKGDGVSHAEKQALHDERGTAATILRRLARWSFRLIIVLALLAGAALALYVFWLPGYAETRIASVLEDMGLDEAQMRVGHIGLDRSSLHDVVIGDDRLRIAELRVTYDVSGLRQGEVKTLSIIGLTLTIGVNENGELDLSPLDQITMPPPEGDDQGWPVERIELLASRLIVQQADGESWTVPLQGEVALADNTAELRLASVLPDRRLTLSATAKREGDAWHVGDGRLQLTPSDLALPGTAVMARGLMADLRFAATLGTEQLMFIISKDSTIALADADGELGGVDLAPSATDIPLLRITAVSSIGLGVTRGDDAGWWMSAEDVRVAFAAPRVTTAADNVQVEQIEAEVAIAITALPGEVTVTLPHPAKVTWAQLHSGEIAAGAASLLIRTQPDAPVTWADGVLKGALIAEASGPLEVRTPEVVATLPQVRVPVQVTYGADAFSAIAHVNMTKAALSSTKPAWAVREITAAVPVALNAKPQAAGTFSVGAIEAGDAKLPGLTGAASMIDGRISAKANWPLTSELNVQLAAAYEGGAGEVLLKAPPTVIADPATFGRFIPALAAMEIDGVFSLDGRITIANGELDPHITLEASKAAVRHKELGIDASGILGNLVIDSFDPLASPSQQYIAADQVKLGDITFNDWIVWFRVDDAQHLFIEETRWVMGDAGRFITFAIPLNLEDPKIRTQLFVEDLDLETWMSVLTGETVQATGELYGRIAVAFDPDADDPLQLDPGFLYTAPGGGTLRFENPTTVRSILEAAGSGLEAAGQDLKERLVQSLINYQYEMFRFDIVPRDGEGAVLRIQTSGKGLEENAVPIGNLTVNITGFEEAANAALGFKAALDRLKERTLNPAGRTNP